MRSPHVLLDQQLEAMSHPETPVSYSLIITRQITDMMMDERITLEEFEHYCERLRRITAQGKEAA